jgi:hypothetical protein
MNGLKIISQQCAKDPEYAWALFCNIAMPLVDAAGLSHKAANEAAAHLMQHLFECDITTHEHYQYEKSGAQSYAEFRIAMDLKEDAEIAARHIAA